MRRFAALYERLDRSTGTADKRRALVEYFRDAPPRDAAWALWLLSGGKIGGARAKIAATGELRTWIGEETGTPDWLVEACHHQVGDLAETLALLLDDPPVDDSLPTHARDEPSLADWIEHRLAPVANAEPELRRAVIVDAWHQLVFRERLVFNKLLTGALRVGVSQGLVQQALAELSGVDIAMIAQRMLGRWTPGAGFLETLLSPEPQPGDAALPYPFFLASPLEVDAATLGPLEEWLLEWKWDGIRLQLIRRPGEIALWSRGEERMDGRFPEIEAAAARLTRDCVIDGELLAWEPGADGPMPFSALQTRIQRLKPGPRALAAAPARVIAYDLLELDGVDLRARSLDDRRALLMDLLAPDSGTDAARIAPSPAVEASDWTHAATIREQSRELGVEGLMLKRRDSPYRHGRKRGDWWKWKVDPLSIDAVLIYAQSGSGRRSTLFTDYTFGLWDGEALVPVAKAYSGLDDAEMLRLDRWIRGHTLERFGPVRSVEAVHVFELGFEGVNRSTRHKSGIAVRFPRILRWREDKPAREADRLDALRALAR
ncbi:ATP-dependent DNA ligase [Luteimonas sp. MC1750]|uniref:ATP-dependent DNA ligase n=1 Tax=Luteimonas sp. MC1750 TaxID=2799326 RepID=UPI0018F08E16|nr:ATP-dependent DNA ligase [Luteimonas sp. MC1750]MBJ6983718.1 ATP-dependent DNA ligase [Luteimonas sp. MC1750]QQO06554.1 ATP-dependent DNA ligase [Luteimonas sp. MC1750]